MTPISLFSVSLLGLYNVVQGRHIQEATTAANCYASSPPSQYHHHSSFAHALWMPTRSSTAPSHTARTTYGPSYSAASSLIPGLSTTSWGNWNPKDSRTATDTANPYGSAAFSSLWHNMNFANFTTGLYSTTVQPTPIPSSELVPPPPLYFQPPASCYSFPKAFIFGAAAAAAQIEGAIAQEGRTPAVPDKFGDVFTLLGGVLSINGLDTNLAVANNYVADESYYLYKQDILRLATIGIKYYSFSIPWSRILPFVHPGTPANQQALQHYNDLINYAIPLGIQPIVTLYHWDTPLDLVGGPSGYLAALTQRSYYGVANFGLANATFEDSFVHYGKIVMAHFADRVPIWVTFNEPQITCSNGAAINTVVKSHARLAHFYREGLKGTGKVTFKNAIPPSNPLDPKNASDVTASQHYNDLYLGTFLNPLVLGTDYPEAFKRTVQDYVPLSKDDLKYLKGTAGEINSCAANNASTNLQYPSCVGQTRNDASGWLEGYHADYVSYTAPKLLRSQIKYLWDKFKVPVIITEFGHAETYPKDLTVQDLRFDVPRSEYYLSCLSEILKAIWEDGVDVVAALAWSHLDNWEWGTYDHHYGLQYVNRTSQERFYKRSFFDVVDFVESKRSKQ